MLKDCCPITGPGKYRLRNGATADIHVLRGAERPRGAMWYGVVLGSSRPHQSWYEAGSYWPFECNDPHDLDVVARIN